MGLVLFRVADNFDVCVFRVDDTSVNACLQKGMRQLNVLAFVLVLWEIHCLKFVLPIHHIGHIEYLFQVIRFLRLVKRKLPLFRWISLYLRNTRVLTGLHVRCLLPKRAKLFHSTSSLYDVLLTRQRFHGHPRVYSFRDLSLHDFAL